jgi:hypothetical protein
MKKVAVCLAILILTAGALKAQDAGLFAGYEISAGRIGLDVRYLMDFNFLTDGVDDEVLKRRGIYIALGYEMEF